jgi:hypothetical protein
MERYYLFLDESGDHGLNNLDPNFPVFVLCGALMSQADYFVFRDGLNLIKNRYWGTKQVILHSRDIRKCEKEFKILFDLNIKKSFYEDLDHLLSKSNYTIIADGIQKEEYIKHYGRLSKVYGLCLSFIIERAIFCLDQIPVEKKLYIIVEERGKKENKELRDYFESVLNHGTSFVSSQRLKQIGLKLEFRSKKKNINGLQLADLIAYPIANFILNKDRPNPAFKIIESKFYTKNGVRYGLKTYP